MADGGPPTRADGVHGDLRVVELTLGPGGCSVQGPGHNSNPVQARLASQQVGTRGRLIRTDTGIALRPLGGDDDIELRCHNPAALDDLFDRFGPDGWRVSHSLLVSDRGVGLSVAAGRSLRPCRPCEFACCRGKRTTDEAL